MVTLWNIEKNSLTHRISQNFKYTVNFFFTTPVHQGEKNFDLAYFLLKERVFLLTEVVFGEAGAETLLLVTLGPVLPLQVRVALQSLSWIMGDW
jgi:hypothetical protein